MALPKTVKYLLCYLPFILVGTGLVVYGVLQQESARIASLIVGVVVLFSGLFAWCTDSDVGCFVVCSCWSHKDRKLKIKKSSKSTGFEVDQDIFTIHNKRATSPQTQASTKKSNTNAGAVEAALELSSSSPDHNTKEGAENNNKENSKMIQRDRHNNYGQYSLHQSRHMDEEAGLGGGRRTRFPTRAPSLDNHLNTYKPNGIHGRQEMRLTVRNLQKLDKMRQHNKSIDSDPRGNPHEAYIASGNHQIMSNEAFELEFTLSIQKRESIKNWITDVHHSREDVGVMTNNNVAGSDPLQQKQQHPQHQQQQQQQHQQQQQQQQNQNQNQVPLWAMNQQNKGYDSNKIQRKPLPREPSADRYSSTASGSNIDIEVHSLPRSFGSDGNKSPTGTLDRIDSPDIEQSGPQQQFEMNRYGRFLYYVIQFLICF